MTIVARLTALLTANSTTFESNLVKANKAMNRAQQSWNTDLNRASRSFSNFETHTRRSIGSIADLKTQLGGLTTAVAGALSIQKVIQYSDTWKQTSSRLALVTRDLEEMTKVQDELFRISQRNSTPVNDTADAYIKLAMATSDAQKQQYDMLRVTDLLAKTLKISGTNGEGSKIFLQQFGQAASNDFKAIGQELQTFADQNSTFFQIIRKESEKSGKTLKDFAKDGGLSFSFVADALLNAADQIDGQAERISLTVSQALTQLDNAFLQFIGRSDAVRGGTTSMALVIKTLADNFGLLASAVTTVAVAYGVRLVAALVTTVANTVASTLAFYANGIALGRLVGISAAATIGTITFAGATTTLTAAFSTLGGVLNAIILPAFIAYSIHAHKAREAEAAFQSQMAQFRNLSIEYQNASEEAKQKIVEDSKQRMAVYKSELSALTVLIGQYAKLGNGNFLQRLIGATGLGVEEGLGKLGVGQAPSEQLAHAEALQKAIAEIQGFLDDPMGSGTSPGSSKSSGNSEAQKKIDSIIGGLRQESEQLKLQTKLYGQKESAIKRAQEALKIEQTLRANNITLTKAQRDEIEAYLDTIEALYEENKQLTEQQQRLEAVSESVGSTISDSLADAITEAETLADVLDILESTLKNVEKAFIKAFITDPLGDSITDFAKDVLASSGGGGGGIGGFFSDIFGSFASGIDYVPKDGVAKLHRGEAVMRASEVNSLRNGGGTVNVIIQNNNGSQVGQQTRQNGNDTDLIIMIDQATARNINRKGSQTQEALAGQMGRTLVRR